ncbi:MAG: glycoside hydrolase family 127 protein [Eubacteriales bacterium]|nr:glycoside hydrolase family 127 protein [Eubacteriales bacterium]
MDTLNRFTSLPGFLKRYEDLIIREIVPYQEKILWDQVEGAEKSHAFENFLLAAQKLETGRCEGTFYGMVFQDSDVAKWLEAVAYSLRIRLDAALEKRADEVIELIARAQHADGYLNTYFTVKAPDKRWSNLEEAHELYCAGHMIEAAVAMAECTGKTRLLAIMRRMADLMVKHFITENNEGFPGHPEVELALMRLYRYTGEADYLRLAQRFIDTRGSDFFTREREHRQWAIWSGHDDREYTQTHLPVREQRDAVGHAVRAIYLYSGMADVARETGEPALLEACRALWESVTRRRMYLTGAIGSAYEGESFTRDYHLPNDTAYAETCAAVGLVFFARRMLEMEKRSEYADAMERALYNCVLAGMQLDGTRFFYVNPLESLPGISGEAVTHRHALPQRPKWFTCACCPPNVARLLTSLGRYAWGLDEKAITAHLFVPGRLTLDDGAAVTLSTAYPAEGKLRFRFEAKKLPVNRAFALRLPAWSEHTEIRRNGSTAAYEERDGYAVLLGPFHDGDEVTVTLSMTPRRIYPSVRIGADSDRVAFTRGPLVYCAECVDNGGHVLNLQIEPESEIRVVPAEMLGGVATLRVQGRRLSDDGELYAYTRPQAEPCEITLIPYYAWSNRGLTEMRVWLPEA